MAISAAVHAIMCGISLSITRPPKSNTKEKGNDGVGGFGANIDHTSLAVIGFTFKPTPYLTILTWFCSPTERRDTKRVEMKVVILTNKRVYTRCSQF
jgi:hypothetical protein